MRLRPAATAWTLLFPLLFAANAFALEETIVVRPGDPQLSVKVEKRPKGRLRLTIGREFSKAPERLRTGWLTVANEEGFLAECELRPRTNERTVSYTFELSRDCLHHSTFLLREEPRPEPGKPRQLGGATNYSISPADFVKKPSGKRGR